MVGKKKKVVVGKETREMWGLLFLMMSDDGGVL